MVVGRAGWKRQLSLVLGICPLAFACASDALPDTSPTAVSATVSQNVGTAVTVKWTTSSPTIGYVSYGTTTKLGETTPLDKEATGTTAHAQTLLLPANTTYYYRVITWDAPNATAGASDVLSFRTAALPPGTPQFTVQSFPVKDMGGVNEDPMQDFVVIPFVGQKTTLVLVDPAGTPIWYHVEERDRRVTRARLSTDKKAVLYNAAGKDAATAADSEIVRAPLDGSATTSVRIPNLGADFTVDAAGTLAALVPEVRNVNGATVTGDQIVEVTSDGVQRTAWSAFDCFDPATSPGDMADGLWTAASALQVSSASDAYFVALKNLSTLVKVDRKTRACTWIVGNDPKSTLHYAAGSAPFARPGSFFANDTRLVVFDSTGNASGARFMDYTLDQTLLTATQVQTYPAAPSVKVTTFGEATPVIGDDRLVNFGSGGKLELVDKLGQLKWSLQVTSGESLAYHTAFRGLAMPNIEGNQ
jgi:hypothetical protein